MKMRVTNILVIAIVLFGLIGYSIYGYMYREHRHIASEDIDYTLSSNDLKNIMRVDTLSDQFIDKVIQTEGIITAVEQNSVLINDAIQVNFTNTDVSALQPQATLSIKGRCVGYDDLLEVVKIDQATITNP
ncbi:hypothetical protein MHTCC0001_30460 [Flavobacteriaceae bacterium MHTCC 0001]